MARRPAPVGVDRRQQILEAALDVCAEEGFDGATTKEIAARADVTHGLIYFYFPSKEDLFLAAFEHHAKLALEQLDFAAEHGEDEPPEVVVRRMVGRFIDVMASPRSLSLLRVMMRVAVHRDRQEPITPTGEPCPETRQSRIRAVGMRLVEQLTAYLGEQMARGTLRPLDPSLAAEFLMGGMAVVLTRQAKATAETRPLPTGALADTITTLFLHGLDPASTASANQENA